LLALDIDIFGINRAINDVELEVIKKDIDSQFTIRTYLNFFEEMCAAINSGVGNEKLAYAIASPAVIRAYNIFETFIDYIRQQYGDDEIFIEIEKTALKWKIKQLNDKSNREQKMLKLKSSLSNRKGTKNIT